MRMSNNIMSPESKHASKETYVTLEIMHESRDMTGLASLLNLPSSITGWQTGYPDDARADPPRVHLWAYSTWGSADQRDFGAHLDLLLDRLQGKEQVVQQLRRQQYRLYIKCVWVAVGQLDHGPAFTVAQLQELAKFEIPIRFTFFVEEPDIDEVQVS
jgi:hypothetical protein